MFSISAASSASASSRSRTSAGIVSRPASRAARQRRSPATSSNVPPGDGPDEHRLQHPALAQRARQRLQRRVVEDAARLLGVGDDHVDRQRAQVVGTGRALAGHGEDRPEPAAHPAAGRAHEAIPARTTSLASSKYASEPAQWGS